MNRKWIFSMIVLFLGIQLQAQCIKSSSEEKLLKHIQYLADDKLEGRLTGTPGEMLAAQYISKCFKSVGVMPAGDNGYLQSFDFISEVIPTEKTFLKVDGTSWVAGTDYYPVNGSGNGT